MRRIMIVTAGIAVTAALVTACDTGGEATAPPTASAGATVSDTPPQSTADTASCEEKQNWSTEDTQADPTSTDAFYLVRAGKHDCYDRVVLDINGPAEVGYLVGYVPTVTADGSGEEIPVDGDAALQVIVRAPEQGLDSGGHQPGRKPAKTGDYFYTADQLADWSSLRAVRFAGSFEGQTTLAVGVRDKLPFHVSTQLDAKDKVRHLIIDIAHDQP